MTDFAESFENLIERINHVTGTGANRELYRRLESSESLYKQELQNIENNEQRISNISINDLEFKYRLLCQRVWEVLKPAINKDISKYSDVFTMSEIQEMEKSINIEGIVLNKEIINDVITITEKIYDKHNI